MTRRVTRRTRHPQPFPARAHIEAQLAEMLAVEVEPGAKEWRCACLAQGWYWTREQQADLGKLPVPFEPIEHDLDSSIASVWCLCETTFRIACVVDLTQDDAIMELTTRVQVISLGPPKAGSPMMICLSVTA